MELTLEPLKQMKTMQNHEYTLKADLLEKVIIFYHSQGPPTYLLEKVIIFRHSHAKKF